MLIYNPDTPILFINNKYAPCRSVNLDKINKFKPTRFYISSEKEELDNILKLINWECQVNTFTRHNASNDFIDSISWFFENEAEGIILDSTAVPYDDFFGFCSALLEKYRNNGRISMVSGGFFKNKIIVGGDTDKTYYYSKFTETAGWAGWRNRWITSGGGMITLENFIGNDHLEKNASLKNFKVRWYDLFKKYHQGGNFNDVGLRFIFGNIVNDSLSVIPTHSFLDFAYDPVNGVISKKEIRVDDIEHPDLIVCDDKKDILYQELKFQLPVSTKNEPDGQIFLKEKLLTFGTDLTPASGRIKIPKIIHQIYEDPTGPPEMLLDIAESWKEKNPAWEYRFWNKAAMENFLEEYFPDFIPIYRSYPFNVQRWDAIRYLILYIIGGLYVDFDYECIEPLDVIMCDSTCCMGMEPTLNALKRDKRLIVGNAFMASVPRHKYFEALINDMIENKDAVFSVNDALQVIETTGPFLTTRVYEKLSEKDKGDVMLMPADLVTPLTMEEVRMMFNDQVTPAIEEKIENAFAIHYFLGSWVEQTLKVQESKKVSIKLKV